jgi:hypothetical protein
MLGLAAAAAVEVARPRSLRAPSPAVCATRDYPRSHHLVVYRLTSPEAVRLLVRNVGWLIVAASHFRGTAGPNSLRGQGQAKSASSA